MEKKLYSISSELKRISEISDSDEDVKKKLAFSLGLSPKRSLKIILSRLADAIQRSDELTVYLRDYEDVDIPKEKHPVTYNIFSKEDCFLTYENSDEVVCYEDKILVIDQIPNPSGIFEKEITGELFSVTYDRSGFISSALIVTEDQDAYEIFDFDGVVYKPE